MAGASVRRMRGGLAAERMYHETAMLSIELVSLTSGSFFGGSLFIVDNFIAWS